MQYTGDKLKKTVQIERKNEPVERIDPYFPDEDLVKAVELAMILERPLLLKGEPGCGKTRLAQAVAYELHHKQGKSGQITTDYRDLYFEWNVKSISKAREGLYNFDHISRLRDANNPHGKPAPDEKYLKYGPLGRAFLKSNDKKGRPVVLIDEIDKADIDFPNDLLLELDQLRFEIPEIKELDGTEKKIAADRAFAPIVFITSNDEKELPPAFLRRCLFYYIEFPRKNILTKIIQSRHPNLNKTVMLAAIERFDALRDRLKAEGGAKNVSTGELLDWVRIIDHFREQESNPALDKDDLPYYQALLKSYSDVNLILKNNAR